MVVVYESMKAIRKIYILIKRPMEALIGNVKKPVAFSTVNTLGFV